MAHNLDITNGTASFVSAREDAWHQLGVTLPAGFTAEQAMEHGKLGNWNVRKLPLTVETEEGWSLPVPGRHAVVRTNPVEADRTDVLGVVGDSYHIVQNEAHAEFLNTLVDESGAHFETAGALDGGRRVFVTMKLPGHLKVGGVDQVDRYLAAINSHDGSMAFTLMVTPVRIVCQNTLNLAFGGQPPIVRLRHTAGIKGLVGQAREALQISFDYLDNFQAEADRLINTTMTQARFEEIISKEWGPVSDAAQSAQTRAERKVDQMAELFSDAFTQEGVRNTAWAGFNALTEYADHYSPTRGDDRDNSRAVNAVLQPRFKTRALELMLAG